jgi:hypothetical protein
LKIQGAESEYNIFLFIIKLDLYETYSINHLWRFHHLLPFLPLAGSQTWLVPLFICGLDPCWCLVLLPRAPVAMAEVIGSWHWRER